MPVQVKSPLHNLHVCALFVALMMHVQAIYAEAPHTAELRAEYDRVSAEFGSSGPGWRPKSPLIGSLLFIASDEYSPVDMETEQFRNQGDVYADKLFALAQQAAKAGQLSLAFQWATETLRENPDHEDARRVLGYEKRDGRWLTPYGVRMADAEKEWHPKFGWLAEADVARYEAGDRLIGSRWISAEEDAARHRDMKKGWQVRTDHFLVTTNHSLEAGVELAARLERLHQVWRQLFAGFYMTENEVRRLFAGERPPRKQVRPFRVYYHRDKEQYINALRSRQPRIAETLGIYFDDTREAHFFAESDESPDARPIATLYHEAVHQLFQETKPAAKDVGRLANFWVIEGVATYFETLREHNDPTAGLYFTIGEPGAGRLPASRQRLRDGFYVSLAELTPLGKFDVQRYPDIAKLYSQSCGLTAFFMDGQRGRYREPLVRYLDAVYAGRDNELSLSKVMEISYSELDAQYRRYMENLP